MADGLLTSDDFASRIRTKYPGAYDHLSNEELTQKIVTKHPEYQQHLTPGVPRPQVNMQQENIPAGMKGFIPQDLPGAGEGANLAAPLGEYAADVASGIGGGAKDIAEGNVTRGAHRMIGGAGAALTPLLPFGAAASPVGLGGALVGGYGGGKLAQYGAEKLGATPDQAALAGDVGNIGGGLIGGAVGHGLQTAGMRAFTPHEPNAAITEGLHVPAKSSMMAQTVKDVEGARPYLEGAKSQAELQQRIPGAKQQVWDPYQKAVDSIKNQATQVKNLETGNPMTVGELEAERQTLSARLRQLKKAKPTDKASILQKDTDVADMAAREKEIINALDPELQKTGIDPKEIRRVHGNLKGVERNVSGKSTVTEKLQPFGVRKMVPHGVPRILGGEGFQWSPIEGIRDIRSGQSGMLKPTDVGIERIFKPKK